MSAPAPHARGPAQRLLRGARLFPLSDKACRCDGGNIEVVKILLANQADVNQPDTFNQVPTFRPCLVCYLLARSCSRRNTCVVVWSKRRRNA